MLINILYIIIINKSILNLIINVLNMHNIKKYREFKGQERKYPGGSGTAGPESGEDTRRENPGGTDRFLAGRTQGNPGIHRGRDQSKAHGGYRRLEPSGKSGTDRQGTSGGYLGKSGTPDGGNPGTGGKAAAGGRKSEVSAGRRQTDGRAVRTGESCSG